MSSQCWSSQGWSSQGWSSRGWSLEGRCRWSCGCPRSRKQHEPVWRAWAMIARRAAAGQWIRQRGGDTSSTPSDRGRRSAVPSNPRSDEHARAPVAPAEARRGEFPERYARTNTPRGSVIESNRFSVCGNAVQLLGFHTSACAYPGKRTTQRISLRIGRGGFVRANGVVVDA